MAVIIPTKAIIPNAMIDMVSPLRSLLLRTVLNANEKTSLVFIFPEIKKKILASSETLQMLTIKSKGGIKSDQDKFQIQLLKQLIQPMSI